jgi:hypothetical protein
MIKGIINLFVFMWIQCVPNKNRRDHYEFSLDDHLIDVLRGVDGGF